MDCFGYYGHFRNINSSSPWTWDIFPFLCIVFNFLHQCFTVFGVWSFISLVKFIPRYFILFDGILQRIVLLLSLSNSLLLVYRKGTDLCILILYPATLLNSFISSNSFLVETLEFSTYRITNSDSFTSSLPLIIVN